MLKKLFVMVFCISIAFVFCACGKKTYDKRYTHKEYGEWEQVASQEGAHDFETVSVEGGKEVTNTFNIGLSVDIQDTIEVEFGYDFANGKIYETGTTAVINRGERIEFYIRTVYDVYDIIQIKPSGEEIVIAEYGKPASVQYRKIVYDEDMNVIRDSENPNYKEPEKENEKNEQDIIESYIKRSENEVISQDELRNLSDEEFKYVYNGIFAYCGRIYGGELGKYYEKYDWYKPSIQGKDFIWDKYFNYFQVQTMNNVVEIREERAG